ncbi:complement factor H-like [Pseudophryne corroboree]|uniref:complement factor H-like n=1 Tax=Pseudophryne corroboree TaxID=495146 RepID=UPI003081CDC3
MPVLEFIFGIVPFVLCCYAAPANDKGLAPCAKPPQMKNAGLSDDWNDETYRPGTVANYQCHPGYIIAPKMVCSGGKWEILRRGECRKRPCGNPGDILFGKFELINEEAFVFGAVVEYSCNEGYQMITKHRKRECTATGWTNERPHCEVRLCPPVMDDSLTVLTTVFDGEFSVGHVIQLKCKNPMNELNGPSEIFCTTNGTWNIDPPTCKDTSEPCLLNNIQLGENNVRLVKKYENTVYAKHGDVLELECLPEHEISDPSLLRITCTRGVMLYPKCVRKESYLNINDQLGGKNVQLSGNKVKESAKNGRKPCGQPPPIKFGEITSKTTYISRTYPSGSSVTYQCPQMYKVEGHKLIRCRNGVWDDPPVCLEPCTTNENTMDENHIVLRWRGNSKFCNRNEQNDQLAKKCYVPHGNTIRFTCLSGYEIPNPNDLKSKCNRGVLQYPTCFKRAKKRVLPSTQ